MTKKQYILYILDSLEEVWDTAKGLKIVINDLDDSNDKLLDDLFLVFKKSITKLNDKKVLDTFSTAQKKLKEMRTKELKEKCIDNDAILDLEKQLDNIIY